jgi:hypothetical protein
MKDQKFRLKKFYNILLKIKGLIQNFLIYDKLFRDEGSNGTSKLEVKALFQDFIISNHQSIAKQNTDLADANNKAPHTSHVRMCHITDY